MTEQEKKNRYDNVRITNISDGTTIEGHDAVKAHFEREERMVKEHGSSLIFQVYRINMEAKSLQELQGEKLAEIKVEAELVSGTDTVVIVKKKVRSLLEEKARLMSKDGSQLDLNIEEADQITLFFNSSQMQDDKSFYSAHFMMLPAWVQVFLHRCEFRKIIELAAKLRSTEETGTSKE